MANGTWKQADRFEDVADAANAACRPDPLFDLVLRYDLPFEVVRSSFVQVHESDAQEWLASESQRFHLTHGAYFQGERGLDHVVHELKRRAGSRRALLSLVAMDHMLGSGDEPVPSFMILQFAVEAETLYATAYFRALEVTRFLPINLTEIALHCRRLDEGFPAHEKAEVDRVSLAKVATTVYRGDTAQVKEWLLGKRARDSKVVTAGLEAIRDAAEDAEEIYSASFLDAMNQLIEAQRRVRAYRRLRSEGRQIDSAWEEAAEHLERALAELPDP
jgi:hypothetical protein